MNLLLTTLNAKYIHINLAIRLLYELNKSHEGLAWKEFTIKEDKDAIADYCKDFEVVAFSCYIWNITQTLAVARAIKERNPSVKILLGGPEVSYEWEDVIALPEVDYIIVGEGEIPFQRFLAQYPAIQNIPNLVYKEVEKTCFLPDSATFDLKLYKDIMPYREDPVEELSNKVAYIETSRGCPYKCEFCLASLDNKVRYLPNETIKEHLLHLMQHGRVIKFLDRTFNIKRDFTLDIFQFILDNYRPDNVFQFEITADILHPDIIAFINEKVPKGLFRFEIGIQTVNQKANLAVSRRQNFDKTKRIIEAVREKVELHLDLIVGLPLDEWEDIKYSFEEVFKIFPPELQLGFLKFLKGTPVREKYEEHGFVFDPEPPYQIIRSNFLSEEQLRKIVVVENALEIYWNKDRARHALRYVTAKYGSFDFLLGLGTHFESKRQFHKYNLSDVYQLLSEYAQMHFAEDVYLQELIGVDYYLFHKLKPASLYLSEISKGDKNTLLHQLGVNPHTLRYLAFPISFDWKKFVSQNQIEAAQQVWVISYDGQEKAKVLGAVERVVLEG